MYAYLNGARRAGGTLVCYVRVKEAGPFGELGILIAEEVGTEGSSFTPA